MFDLGLDEDLFKISYFVIKF